MILRDAIHEKKNIVFETTGARKQEDTFQPVDMTWLYHLVKPVYHIVAAFSHVNFCELVRRNKSRAMRQMNEYIEGNINGKQGTVPAPRLPNVLDDKDHTEYRKLTKII